MQGIMPGCEDTQGNNATNIAASDKPHPLPACGKRIEGGLSYGANCSKIESHIFSTIVMSRLALSGQ